MAEKFRITFSEAYYKKKDILNDEIIITSGPKKETWYGALFQFLSFGLYKAPLKYPVEYEAKVL